MTSKFPLIALGLVLFALGMSPAEAAITPTEVAHGYLGDVLVWLLAVLAVAGGAWFARKK